MKYNTKNFYNPNERITDYDLMKLPARSTNEEKLQFLWDNNHRDYIDLPLLERVRFPTLINTPINAKGWSCGNFYMKPMDGFHNIFEMEELKNQVVPKTVEVQAKEANEKAVKQALEVKPIKLQPTHENEALEQQKQMDEATQGMLHSLNEQPVIEKKEPIPEEKVVVSVEAKENVKEAVTETTKEEELQDTAEVKAEAEKLSDGNVTEDKESVSDNKEIEVSNVTEGTSEETSERISQGKSEISNEAEPEEPKTESESTKSDAKTSKKSNELKTYKGRRKAGMSNLLGDRLDLGEMSKTVKNGNSKESDSN